MGAETCNFQRSTLNVQWGVRRHSALGLGRIGAR